MAKKRKRSAPPARSTSTEPGPPLSPIAVDLRPWAAYVLGHHSRALRLWQNVYWQNPQEEWGAWDGVPLTIDEMDTARQHLVALMAGNVYNELPVRFTALRTINDDIFEAWSKGVPYRTRHFGDNSSPGGEEAKTLAILADQALGDTDPLKHWYRVGVALGHYRAELFIEEHEEVRASILWVVEAVRALPKLTRKIVPLLEALVAVSAPSADESTIVRAFFQKLRDPRRFDGRDPVEDRYLQDSIGTTLDGAIQSALKEVTVTPRTLPVKSKPHWDKERFELRVAEEVVRRVRGIARNVITILDSFQESHWCDRIDDPIPGGHDGQKARLDEAIKSLNDGLRIIRFGGDGTGKGIVWRWL